MAQVELLNQQIAALRRQLAALEDALEASEKQGQGSQARIADLGQRLNVALAQRVQELARYPLGLLRPPARDPRQPPRHPHRRRPLRVPVGGALRCRPGRAAARGGRAELDKLATALTELERQIPPDIAWVLRVDGHTDERPIASAQFPSNWELSAARAISVVQYLIGKGIPPQHLVAAGFGEFQPLDPATTDEAYRRNRRIELKLTER